MSDYSAFGYLNHFFEPICGFGVIFLVTLFLALEINNAKNGC